ncbi:amine oxidase [Grosmannia clavigera kw1407]|uniref:Amine oxidase n=1 Tax=Grosmannia clavigera (strain kw1407 / UAMH 11150) TaxID=655863 RepID=F0X7X4_GROCL|nr:amine oxidase [Grosmannia clavigera kw1407]EFX06228.1 amine oxidase [Grosmannia clavigera kw1407]
MAAIVPRKKVAIVGSGCSGIAALWALNRTHHDVYVYEAADRLGGHTNTVAWRVGKYTAQVDTGFSVMNTTAYPNFTNFLRKIRVSTAPTEATFSVCRDQGAFEWAGASLDTFFCQRRNLFSPSMWRMIFDIVRFNQFAPDLLEEDTAGYYTDAQETIGQYLQRQGYSDAFRDNYLIPLTAALWSTNPGTCALEFPIVTLVRFLWDRHLLSLLARRPKCQTIETGATSYIDIVTRGFPTNHLLRNTPVRSVTNEPDGRVRVHLDGDRSEVYDHVILATHGDEAYAIIKPSATPEEKEILSCFHTSENVAVLHSDTSLLPRSRKAWSSWNYLSLSSHLPDHKPIDQVSLTYNMNIIQRIPTDILGHVLVTLNPLKEPNPATVRGRFRYSQPLYTAEAVQAQQLLPLIQNKRGISYAGAWTKYGFHEDGFTSGLIVATQHLGAKLPFELVDSTSSQRPARRLGLIGWILRIAVWLIQVFIVETVERLLSVSRDGQPVLAYGVGKRPGTEALVIRQFDAHSHVATAMASIIRPLIRLPRQSMWGACSNCRAGLSPSVPRRLLNNTARRWQQRQEEASAPNMDRMKTNYKIRNRTTLFYTLSVILGTVAFSYGSVPMYKMICQTTGWGGQPVRAPGHGGAGGDGGDLASRLQPVTDAKRLRVTFHASVSDVLPWKFVPQQREVRVLPGETALAFYTATNKSDTDIIGVATYSVTPAQVAPYFSKIQCFCFEEQRLAAGETVDMPVFFYLDPDMLNDLNMKGVETVTLSYTFFKAKYDDNGKVTNIPQAGQT